MAFVNEFISKEDRDHFNLNAFDCRLPIVNPGGSWAIDRERKIFLRIVRPAARKNEPGDPNGRFEKDFHFHWGGRDFLISTRRIDGQELKDWPGRIFEPAPNYEPTVEGHFFYLRHIGQLDGEHSETTDSLVHDQVEILRDLQEALRIGCGGVFANLTPEQAEHPRYAVIKIAPNAGV